MKTKEKLLFLARKAKSGNFVSFEYSKNLPNGKTETSKRTVRIGIDVEKKMEKQGTPIKLVGNWASGKHFGLRGTFVRQENDYVIQATDLKDNKFKYFKVSQINNLK